jgi:CubicO group peptidase (beta-lactamase class C family)
MQRDSIVTSFSVAKSFTSALIGIAIQEGYIHSVNDPITMYLPELDKRDPRFGEITIRHLLLMASGLEYKSFRPLLLNSDDILTTYYPDQRKLALENTNIVDPPGAYYRYNKYHPQLLGLILERTTGMPVTSYLQTRIWDPLGMEYGGSWSVDSKASDFEKMETGVNARAIDFAKFGVLFLNGGSWQGKQVISQDWVNESTRPLFPQNYAEYYTDWYELLPGEGHYKYMWYSLVRDGDSYDFAAEGDKGQFIYVSPQKKLVIVRNGTEYGIPSEEWFWLFYKFASQL